MASATQKDIEAAVKAIIGEGLGEGRDGQIALAWAIANRAENRGQTLSQAVSDGFDGYSTPGRAAQKAMSDPATVKDITGIVEGVLSGEIPDPIDGADHFFNPQKVNPSWAKSMDKTASINNHDFYNSGKGAGYKPDTQQQAAQAPTPADRPARAGLQLQGLLSSPPPALMQASLPKQERNGAFTNGRGESYTQEIQWGGYDKNLKPEVVAVLNKAQGVLDFPITLNSGYRDAKRNASAGGAKASQHLTGNAVDVSVKGLADSQRTELARALSWAGAERLGAYSGNTALHLDMAKGYDKGGYSAYPMFDRSKNNMANAPDWFTQGLNGTPPSRLAAAPIPADPIDRVQIMPASFQEAPFAADEETQLMDALAMWGGSSVAPSLSYPQGAPAFPASADTPPLPQVGPNGAPLPPAPVGQVKVADLPKLPPNPTSLNAGVALPLSLPAVQTGNVVSRELPALPTNMPTLESQTRARNEAIRSDVATTLATPGRNADLFPGAPPSPTDSLRTQLADLQGGRSQAPDLSRHGQIFDNLPAVPPVPMDRLARPSALPEVPRSYADPQQIEAATGFRVGANLSAPKPDYSMPMPPALPSVPTTPNLPPLPMADPRMGTIKTMPTLPPIPMPTINRPGMFDFGGVKLPGTLGLIQNVAHMAANAKGPHSTGFDNMLGNIFNRNDQRDYVAPQHNYPGNARPGERQDVFGNDMAFQPQSVQTSDRFNTGY